ncbi:MAG TPA: hypothetical protein VFL95_01100 [Gemmatimonadales bacterium]|nr:hypothetical protein [Gemmatimonadales bacterium]
MNSESSIDVEQFMAELATLVNQTAGARGFRRDSEPERDPLGSCTMRYRNGPAELLVGWDAKEQWFTMYYRPVPERPPATEWTGLLSARYIDGNISPADRDQMLASLRAKLETIWPPR